MQAVAPLRKIAALALFLVPSLPALANDSTAELGAGGLQLVQNDKVTVQSEDLFVAADAIRVTYHFRNSSDAPYTALVAFPLPAIDAITPQEMNYVLPDPASDNFVAFTVNADGRPVTPQISARASVLGIDRTAELTRRGLPLNPLADGLYDRIQALPANDIDALKRLALVTDDQNGPEPDWRFELAFYWEQTFAPGRETIIAHSYKPVVGYAFFGESSLADKWYRDKYCIDDAFARAARKKLAAIKSSPNPYLAEKRVSYILTTANNWAAPIRSFRLTLDKGDPDALVSLCASGLRKTGPTTFEMTATDYAPEKELEVLIVSMPKAE